MPRPKPPRIGCGGSPCDPPEGKGSDLLKKRVRQALQQDGISLQKSDLEHLVSVLQDSVNRRRLVQRRWASDRLSKNDIIHFIHDSLKTGDGDEAVWRSFLAAHFGRSSAHGNKADQIESATRLLCAFGAKPVWCWKAVRKKPEDLRKWLSKNRSNLARLRFGNHRKYESKKPKNIWAVIQSFVQLAETHGRHPSLLLNTESEEAKTPADQFSVLYERLQPLHRFGRTGVFDFLELMFHLEIIDAQPDSCYLKGSTGPLAGARRLWGRRPTAELEALAVQFSRRMKVSPATVEDVLCIWQKGQ